MRAASLVLILKIAGAVDVVVQINRYRDEVRRISEIIEVIETDDERKYITNSLYRYKIKGINPGGMLNGDFEIVNKPMFLKEMKEMYHDIPEIWK